MRADPSPRHPGPLSPSHDATDLAPLRAALMAHYDRSARCLPWRGEGDPYRVLVAEVMLQQTRVETVTRYYGPWLARFPDLATLAEAEEDDVLAAWEGLGYYRRARHLHAAARRIRDGLDGRFPSTYAELRELPGVGEYTAGAVASIAFHRAEPAVDGNVRRVLARLHGVHRPGPAWLREVARALVDPERPGDWNQALMDLGATLCTPRAPGCGPCPVRGWCEAAAAGTQDTCPAPVRRARVASATLALAALLRGGRVRLERRPRQGLLGGLWALPEREISGPEAAAAAALHLATSRGFAVVGEPEPLPTCSHRFTHLSATYLPYVVRIERGSECDPDARWVEPREPSGVPIPVAQRAVLRSLADALQGSVSA